MTNKIKRTNYLVRLIKNADKNFNEEGDPGVNGWTLNGSKFEINFFDGEQFPENIGAYVSDITETDTESETDIGEVYFSSDSDEDSLE